MFVVLFFISHNFLVHCPVVVGYTLNHLEHCLPRWRYIGMFLHPKRGAQYVGKSQVSGVTRLGQKLRISSSFFGKIEDTKISFRD